VLNVTSPHGPVWLFFGIGLAMVVGPMVVGWLRLPAIIGLLGGGLVIGPHVIGIVPATDTTLSDLGKLGLLYLMFTAGAELDLLLFQRYRKAALTFGLATFAAPLTTAFVAGQLLDYSVGSSLLLGSVWASHTLVTYPMVRQAGLSGNRAVAATVGATVITDTLSLILLAGVSGSVTGSSGLTQIVGSLLIGLAALGAYTGWLLPRVARWFFTGSGHEPMARYAFLVAAMLSAAVLSEMVGIEGIVGAFFAGLGLNRLVPAGSPLMERVEFFGSAMLVPVFLVSVGVLITPSVLADPATLGVALVFCVVLFLGKGVAALASRPLLGFSRVECALMFGMTLPQAAATLASTTVGYKLGLFGGQVVNAVLVVILVTMLVSSIVTARAADRVEPTVEDLGRELGRKVVLVAEREDRLDGMARVGRALVRREAGLVIPMRVSVHASDLDDDRPFLGLVETVLAKAGLETHSRLRVDPNPVEAVASTLVEEGGTLVMMDWQPSARRQPALEGRPADDLFRLSPVPVVLAAVADAPISRVVLALDGCDLGPENAVGVTTTVDVAQRLVEGDCTRYAIGPDDPGLARLLGDFDGHQEGSPARRVDWVVTDAQPGDLVVLPAHPRWIEYGPTATRAAVKPGVSVLVVADPQRWRARGVGMDPGLGSIMGGGRGVTIPIPVPSRW
jgi:Kef-type K+ transport system membrane component KefB